MSFPSFLTTFSDRVLLKHLFHGHRSKSQHDTRCFLLDNGKSTWLHYCTYNCNNFVATNIKYSGLSRASDSSVIKCALKENVEKKWTVYKCHTKKSLTTKKRDKCTQTILAHFEDASLSLDLIVSKDYNLNYTSKSFQTAVKFWVAPIALFLRQFPRTMTKKWGGGGRERKWKSNVSTQSSLGRFKMWVVGSYLTDITCSNLSSSSEGIASVTPCFLQGRREGGGTGGGGANNESCGTFPASQRSALPNENRWSRDKVFGDIKGVIHQR